MKFLKLILPFPFIGALTAFSPSDTVKRDSTDTAEIKPFTVQNIAQTPETAKSYELITKLENHKKAIQERIDSVFNHLDSISTNKPTDTTRHSRKIVLYDRKGSIESLSTRQCKHNKRSDNKEENQSGNIFAIKHNRGADTVPDRNQYLESQKQSVAENSLSGSRNNSYHSDNLIYSINGIFEKHFGTAHRGRSYDVRPVAIFEAEEQNRFFGDTDREKSRIRQTFDSIGGTNKEIKLVS